MFTATATANAVPLPPALAADLGKHQRTQITARLSGSRVTRFDRASSATVFLKSRPLHDASRPLFDEAERLGWMHAVGLPVPAVLQYHEWKGQEYLLLTAVAGVNAAVPRAPDDQAAVVTALAAGLRALHATNISACPFDQSLRVRLTAAKRRLEAGLVVPSEGDVARQGRSAGDVLAELVATQPAAEARVFTHGDYRMPNVILEEDRPGGYRVSGLVDCDRAGVGDAYQDLARCAGSIAATLGPDLVPVLFARYGLDRVDERKLAYYQLLDELF